MFLGKFSAFMLCTFWEPLKLSGKVRQNEGKKPKVPGFETLPRQTKKERPEASTIKHFKAVINSVLYLVRVFATVSNFYSGSEPTQVAPLLIGYLTWSQILFKGGSD
jgi:hypothetical protein